MAVRDAQGRTREQVRASEAARLVGEIDAKADKRLSQRYNSLAGALPVFIRTNGLLQTIAFLAAKADRAKHPADCAEHLVMDHLSIHLRTASLLAHGKQLLDVLPDVGYERYLRFQEEAIACAAWHKRFSHAQFGAPENS